MIWERWKQLDFLRVSFFKPKLLQELVGIAYCRKHLFTFGQGAQKDVAAKEPRGASKKETHEDSYGITLAVSARTSPLGE